ncbi:MAG: SH3 domain-containing protein, partial [Holosporales bacterium]
TYYRANLPVEIFQEYDVWRHIRDAEGTEGWVHQSVLSGKRHVMVMGTVQAIRAEPDEQAKPVAQLEPGVIAKILKCNEGYCQVQVQGYSGWIGKEHLWGVYASELIK